MKYLTIMCLLCLSLQASAQYMVIHGSDGTKTEIALSNITKLTFDLSSVSVLVPEMQLQVVEKLKIAMAKIFPNPFNPRVEYYLAKESRISIQVFDMQGKKIRTIQYGMMPPGNYSVNWDLCNNSGSKVGNGSYVISVHVGEETISKNLFIVQ